MSSFPLIPAGATLFNKGEVVQGNVPEDSQRTDTDIVDTVDDGPCVWGLPQWQGGLGRGTLHC